MRRFRSGRTHKMANHTNNWLRFFSNYMCTVMHPLEAAHTVYAIVCVSLSESGVIDDNHAVKLHKLWMVKIYLYVWICYICWYTVSECYLCWIAQTLLWVFVALFCVWVTSFFPFVLPFSLLLLFNKLYLGSRRGRHHEVCWLCVCRSECADCEFFCLLCFSELAVRRDGQRESISKLQCLVGFDYIWNN